MTLEPNGYIFRLVTDQRKSQRFDLKLKMQVLRRGTTPVQDFAQTANISSSGVLFHSDIAPEIGEPVEYLLTLMPESPKRKCVQLHCMGKIVRHDEQTRTAAATLERYEFQRS